MNEYKRYIIGYEHDVAELDAILSGYEHHRFRSIPYCSVDVRSKQEEESLLEALAKLPGITYREAARREKLDDKP